MKVIYKESIERHYFTCDLCGNKIIQDGRDICLIYGRKDIGKANESKESEPALHFHETCLIKHFAPLSTLKD